MDEGNGNPDLPAWEANAEHWDDYMGDDSNEWHRDLVRPGVTALLDPHPGERILDIACGNGNYSAYLADMGVMVTAFDFSPRMVGLARRRRQHTMVPVDFRVADASDAEDIASLGEPGGFDKAVCNMGSWTSRTSAPFLPGSTAYSHLAARWCSPRSTRAS